MKPQKLNVKRCLLPELYCGNDTDKSLIDINTEIAKTNKDYYYIGYGTPYECLKKGYGAGMYNERSKGMDEDSLQNIKYVGIKFEHNFQENGVSDIQSLVKYAKNHSTKEIEKLLNVVFIQKNGIIHKKAYNSTILFLHKKNMDKLPQCYNI